MEKELRLSVKRAKLSPLAPVEISSAAKQDFDFLKDVPLVIAAELGRTTLTVKEVLELGEGSVLKLGKLAGEPVELLVNGQPLAQGEVIILGDVLAVRISNFLGEKEES